MPPPANGDLPFAPVSYDLASETAAALSDRAISACASPGPRLHQDQRIIEAQYYPALDATVTGLRFR
jgi:hypothetical protein